MHKEILLDGNPTLPNAKAAPFRVFELDNQSHWEYLFSGETVWFENTHDMRNFLMGLHERCFDSDPVMGEADIFQLSLRFSGSRAMILSDGLWHVIDVRNCTAKLLISFEKRFEAEKLV